MVMKRLVAVLGKEGPSMVRGSSDWNQHWVLLEIDPLL
jgi:hypothetical protein